MLFRSLVDVNEVAALQGIARDSGGVTIMACTRQADAERSAILRDLRLGEFDVLVRSDEKLSKYASSTGEAVFPTCGHIVTARKPRAFRA